VSLTITRVIAFARACVRNRHSRARDSDGRTTTIAESRPRLDQVSPGRGPDRTSPDNLIDAGGAAVAENQRIVRSAEGKPTLCEKVVRTGHEAVTIYVAARIYKVRELRFEKRQTLRQATRGCRLDKSDTGTVASATFAEWRGCVADRRPSRGAGSRT
jgi:hypothetical protein